MLSDSIIPKIPTNGNPDPQDAKAWLQAKIAHYQAEIARLEAELKHVQILLKGHQTWLQDIERKAGRE